jgi:hypothetical protein
MIGYKATINGKCKDMLYEVGQEYTYNGPIELCISGFHFCKELKDVFYYYEYIYGIKVFKVEALGEIITKNDKSVTNHLKIIEVTDISEWVKFDERGNRIYHKNLNGYKVWKEFDKNNNLIHNKSSYGFEEWREFNEKNKIIHYRDINGYESFYEYDENNNLVNEYKGK